VRIYALKLKARGTRLRKIGRNSGRFQENNAPNCEQWLAKKDRNKETINIDYVQQKKQHCCKIL